MSAVIIDIARARLLRDEKDSFVRHAPIYSGHPMKATAEDAEVAEGRRKQTPPSRHCEERSDEAIQTLDRFAPLAMTTQTKRRSASSATSAVNSSHSERE